MQNPHTDFEYLLQNSSPDDPRLLTALIEVYADYAGRLVKALFDDEAFGAVLEAIFLSAFQSLDRYLIGSNFKIWFTKLALKVCWAPDRERRRATVKWPFSTREISPASKQVSLIEWRAIRVPKRRNYLPLILRYYLDLSVDEISEILNIREKKVLDRLERGIQTMMEQAVPDTSAIPLGPGRPIIHRNFRKQAHNFDVLSKEEKTGYLTHLSACPQCLQYQKFLNKLLENIDHLWEPTPFSQEQI